MGTFAVILNTNVANLVITSNKDRVSPEYLRIEFWSLVVLCVALDLPTSRWHSLGRWGLGRNGKLHFLCTWINAMWMFCNLFIVVVRICLSHLWPNPRRAVPFGGGPTDLVI